MTAENRWLFDFDDIKKIHFVCAKCKAALGVTPNALRRVPPQCVNCSEQLYLTQDEQDCLRSLQTAFEAMGRFKSDKLKIRLEFASPQG